MTIKGRNFSQAQVCKRTKLFIYKAALAAISRLLLFSIFPVFETKIYIRLNNAFWLMWKAFIPESFFFQILTHLHGLVVLNENAFNFQVYSYIP